MAGISGLSKVIVAESPAYEGFLPEQLTPLLQAAQDQFKFTHILAASSALSRSVLPRLAAKLDVSPISDIIGVKDKDTFVRTIYAGESITSNCDIWLTDKVTISFYIGNAILTLKSTCLLYTSPSPRDRQKSRMPSSA